MCLHYVYMILKWFQHDSYEGLTRFAEDRLLIFIYDFAQFARLSATRRLPGPYGRLCLPGFYVYLPRHVPKADNHDTREHLFSLQHFLAPKLGPNAFIRGPGRYGKVGEQQRKNSDKFAGRISASVTRYDLKTKWINEHGVDEC